MRCFTYLPDVRGKNCNLYFLSSVPCVRQDNSNFAGPFRITGVLDEDVQFVIKTSTKHLKTICYSLKHILRLQ